MPPAFGDEPLISVVITCFNYGRFVSDAIECALSQGYSRKEVIVVNDGSTDDSLAVISRYAERVRVIDQRNQGHIAAYNHGFAATAGCIVIFLDADDLLEHHALSSVVQAWYPAATKVQYDLKIIDADGRDLGRRFCNFTEDYDASRVRDAFRRTGTYRWPVTAGNAYTRWFLERIFPLTSELGPDGTLNTVAPVYGPVATIPRALGCYRLHGANMWSSDGLDHSRLPDRIHQRQREVAFMRTRAAQHGVPVPSGNVLDHELPFLTYRLMAMKLGLAYAGEEGDSIAGLLWLTVRTLQEERLPLRLSLAHFVWCGVLMTVPRSTARAVIRLRYSRATLVRSALAKARTLLEGRRRAPRASA